MLPHEDKWVQNIKILSIWQITIFLFILLLIEEGVVTGKERLVSAFILLIIFMPLLLALTTVLYLCVRYKQLKTRFRAALGSNQDPSCVKFDEDDDMLDMVLRTTITMRESSTVVIPRPSSIRMDPHRSSLKMDRGVGKENISLVEIGNLRSDRIIEE
jgi:hypothetical protein